MVLSDVVSPVDWEDKTFDGNSSHLFVFGDFPGGSC